MKNTMTEYEIVYALRQDEYAGWSVEGARALTRYLLELEDDCGVEIEFDPVAFRCEYSEFDSAVEAAEHLGWEDDAEEMALEWLEKNTTVIPVDGGGVIIRDW